jgi:hypothetical protein
MGIIMAEIDPVANELTPTQPIDISEILEQQKISASNTPVNLPISTRSR